MSINSFWKVRKGLVLRSIPGDPPSPEDGSIWYSSSAGKFRKRENGVTSDLDVVPETGIYGINGLTNKFQTFSTDDSGTDFNINSAGAEHTFSIPDASETARGLITTGSQTIAGDKVFLISPSIKDTSASFNVQQVFTSSPVLTGDRAITWDVNNSNRNVDLNGDLTVSSNASISGTNTGDQTITLTSDVTGSGTGSFATTIASNAVTNSKLSQMPTLTIKGNNTGSTSNPIDLSVSQVQTMLGITNLYPSYIELTFITGQTLTGSSSNTALASLTFDSKVIKALQISYIIRDTVSGNIRNGVLYVTANNANGVAATARTRSDTYDESGDVGVVWSVASVGDNVQVRYTTTANNKVMNAEVKRFLTP